jgi:D-sedoheptulose 7-phosphate isomerase
MTFSATVLWAENLHEHRRVLETIESLGASVTAATELLAQALSEGGKILLCGNGGSAADAQHLAAEFTGRFIQDRPPLAALALSTDTSALTCISNDYSFAEVFDRQVRALAKRGDVLVVISTSGNSPNVLKAAMAARSKGVVVIGLLGRDGGGLRSLCDVALVVPSNSTARIQEMHILIGHTLCGGGAGAKTCTKYRAGVCNSFRRRSASGWCNPKIH